MNPREFWSPYIGAVSLTFDDGLDCQLEKAIPPMNELGLRGTFYILPTGADWLKRCLPWSEAAAAGHEIGNHSLSHICSNNLMLSAGGLEEKTLEEIEKELKSKGLNQEMIGLLFRQNKLEEFRELLEIMNKPQLIAKILLIFPKEIASHGKIPITKINRILNKDTLVYLIEVLKKKKISEAQVKQVLERIVKGENLKEAFKFEKEDMNIIEEKIMKIMKEKPGLSEKAYMGLVMRKFKEQVSGKEAMEIIKKYVR